MLGLIVAGWVFGNVPPQLSAKEIKDLDLQYQKFYPYRDPLTSKAHKIQLVVVGTASDVEDLRPPVGAFKTKIKMKVKELLGGRVHPHPVPGVDREGAKLPLPPPAGFESVEVLVSEAASEIPKDERIWFLQNLSPATKQQFPQRANAYGRLEGVERWCVAWPESERWLFREYVSQLDQQREMEKQRRDQRLRKRQSYRQALGIAMEEWVPFQDVVNTTYSGWRQREFLAILQPDEWERLSRIYESRKTELEEWPVLDFKTDMAIVASMGVQSSGGYWIEIVALRRKKEGLVVHYVEVKPGKDRPATTAFTEPVHVITCARHDVPITFEAVPEEVQQAMRGK